MHVTGNSNASQVIEAVPGTAYTPKTTKMPTLASSNQLGSGLESRLGQSGVNLGSADAKQGIMR
jgi:hypothetical protein